MHPLPPAMILLLRPFAPLFSRRVWAHVQVLLAGAILAPAQRTVTAALRVMGLAPSPHFQRYHRVLNRDRWSSLAVSRVLLGLLVITFATQGPLVIGVDETVERRRGAKIAAKGIDRDAVRSSHSHFVKAGGLRGICLMLLVPIPWADRVWALPFLTALAPSERANAAQGRRHKTPTDWARQLLRVVRRWYPQRAIVAVADNGNAALRLLAACAALPMPVMVITRLCLDAALVRDPLIRGKAHPLRVRVPSEGGVDGYAVRADGGAEVVQEGVVDVEPAALAAVPQDVRHRVPSVPRVRVPLSLDAPLLVRLQPAFEVAAEDAPIPAKTDDGDFSGMHEPPEGGAADADGRCRLADT